MLQFVSVAVIQIVRVFLFPEKKYKQTNKQKQKEKENLIIAVTFPVLFFGAIAVLTSTVLTL